MSDQVWDTVFLVGTGAEEGAWPPITAAIQDVFPNAPVSTGNQDHANFFMAELIAVFRGIQAYQRVRRETLPSEIPEKLRRLRIRIAERLEEAVSRGNIGLRPLFTQVVELPEWGTARALLTTNWDTLIERRFPGLPRVYVHGRDTDNDRDIPAI